jgi:hypothetical protein
MSKIKKVSFHLSFLMVLILFSEGKKYSEVSLLQLTREKKYSIFIAAMASRSRLNQSLRPLNPKPALRLTAKLVIQMRPFHI